MESQLGIHTYKAQNENANLFNDGWHKYLFLVANRVLIFSLIADIRLMHLVLFY